MKKVLILGAGLVVKPIVTHLLSKGIQVTVASRTQSKADEMIAGNPLGKSVAWTVDKLDELDKMVSEHDVSVSLLPYAHHPMIARYCIKHKKHLVTCSYVKAEMQSLDAEAKAAGVILLNEMGVDPGIDHMSAMRIIDGIHGKGGKVESFYSLCGALPAPEAATNPFKYKFSWSPKGVVMAGNNDAVYLKHGKTIEVPTENLFRNPTIIDFPEVGKLEVYPNRDSIMYKEIYGIPEATTIFRGTMRFQGWCEIIDALKVMKLISYDKTNLEGLTYAGFVAQKIGAKDATNIKQKVADYLHLDVNAYSVNALEWLGYFDNKPMNRKVDSPFEVTSDMMIEKMQLGLYERDMVVMQHTFLASYPDGKKEVIRSRMLDFGTLATDTSIARTVALPAAIGVEMILEGKINLTGVYRPTIPAIYNPVLDNLEHLNIKMVEEYGLPLSEIMQ